MKVNNDVTDVERGRFLETYSAIKTDSGFLTRKLMTEGGPELHARRISIFSKHFRPECNICIDITANAKD